MADKPKVIIPLQDIVKQLKEEFKDHSDRQIRINVQLQSKLDKNYVLVNQLIKYGKNLSRRNRKLEIQVETLMNLLRDNINNGKCCQCQRKDSIINSESNNEWEYNTSQCKSSPDSFHQSENFQEQDFQTESSSTMVNNNDFKEGQTLESIYLSVPNDNNTTMNQNSSKNLQKSDQFVQKNHECFSSTSEKCSFSSSILQDPPAVVKMTNLDNLGDLGNCGAARQDDLEVARSLSSNEWVFTTVESENSREKLHDSPVNKENLHWKNLLNGLGEVTLTGETIQLQDYLGKL